MGNVVLCREFHEPRTRPIRYKQTDRGSGNRQKARFCHQLTYQLRSRRAKRKPHANFSLPRRSARGQQAGHIRAGDEEHDGHQAHQRQQLRPGAILEIGPPARTVAQYQLLGHELGFLRIVHSRVQRQFVFQQCVVQRGDSSGGLFL